MSGRCEGNHDNKKRLLDKSRRRRYTRLSRRSAAGQAISEYAMVLAFVAILIAMVFAFTPQTLGAAVTDCFSNITREVTRMGEAAGNASGS